MRRGRQKSVLVRSSFPEPSLRANEWGKKRTVSEKSHDASLFAPHRHHAAQERRTCARCVPSNLRSALGYRDGGVLPRAVRQDPPQPRGGEQVVEGRLQACRCVPSQVRLRRGSRQWTEGTRVTMSLSMMDNDEALSLPYERVVGLLGEAAERRMRIRCSPGECKTAEVGAREQPCLECGHVL